MSDVLTEDQVERLLVLLDGHRSRFVDSATALGFSLNAAEERLERFERNELEVAGKRERPPP